MQPNSSLIKKIMMHIDFLGKNLYPVGRAMLSSTSVVIVMLGFWGYKIAKKIDCISEDLKNIKKV